MTPPSAAATLRAPAVAPRPGRRGGMARPARSPIPRRVSGPARRAATVQPLPDRLIDRLIGGRAWIAVIAFALIGIVAMQLWVVKLGVGIGRALEHTQLLQRENAVLAGEDSALSSTERVERLALAKGMVLASPGALHFDTTRGPLDVRLAAGALAKPVQTPISPTTTTAPAATATPATPTPAGAATEAVAATTEAQSASATSASAGLTSETQSAPTTASEQAAPTAATASPTPSTEAAAPTTATPPASTAPTTAPLPAFTEAAVQATGSGGGTQVPGG